MDLGCGANGYYWALGYINRVSAVTFADKNPAYLHRLQRSLDNFLDGSSNLLEDTVHYLHGAGLLPSSHLAKDSLQNLKDKAAYEVIDFTVSFPRETKYDHVLCVGSLGCVDNTDQLDHVLSEISTVLKPDGRLYVKWTPYEEANELTCTLQDIGIEGRLNPDFMQLNSAFKRSRLKLVEQTVVANLMSHDGSFSTYQSPIYAILQKP